MPTRHFSPPQRLCALLLLPALLLGCTRAVARPEIETRHMAVDWEQSGTEVLTSDGVSLRGIVLTPAQWPLEGSVKRLLAGDFIGVIDALDLMFHSSTLPDGALREVFDEGYVPVYVRVSNPGPAPRAFSPMRLQVLAEPGRALDPVEPERLPYYLRRIDWERTAVPIAAALFIIAAVVAARETRLDARLWPPRGSVDVQLGVPLGRVESSGAPSGEPGDKGAGGYTGGQRPRDPGVLHGGEIAPGETREGFVFFSHRAQFVDWKTARLAAP